MPKLDYVEANTVVVNQGDTDDDDDASSKDQMSIQSILESMTNKFNETGTRRSTDSARKVNNKAEPTKNKEKVQTRTQSRAESPKAKKIQKVTDQTEEVIKVIKENIPEKKVEKPPSEEEPAKVDGVTKKDANPPKIILTFRTIDENTDHGKKTKISSCISNLSLVPDELSNCDQISGVCVKVEGYDGGRNKSDSEDASKQNVAKDTRLPINEEKEEDKQDKNSSKKDSAAEETQPTPEMNTKNMTNGDVSLEEKSSTEVETPSPATRRSRHKQSRESSEIEEPSLKRSARRLSKEAGKTSVLESAMARKERSNYTEEVTKRRYTKPGRPRKIVAEKRDSVSKTPEKAESPEKIVSPTKAADKIDSIPQLKPLDPSKWNTEKIMSMPKLSPLDPTKWAVDKKDLPKLSPLKPQKEVAPLDNEKNGLDAASIQQKSNRYEGMPKLTPIIKTAEMLQNRFSGEVTIHDIATNRSVLKSNEAFLKPTLKIKKRERPRPVNVVNGGKSSVTAETPLSTESENSMEDVILEEDAIPVKRTRRSMAPSPSTAEGQASKPESTAILNKVREKPASKKSETMQCLCEVRSQLYVTITSAESPLYCTAQDSIDNQSFVCGNEVVDHDDVAMRRPSANIPYIILCRTHKDRLTRHNCCPTCGLFCSQGKFVHCSNGHQYHRNCELIFDDRPHCPHCASHGLSYDVIITMTGKRKPMTVSPRKPVPKEPHAKITLPGVGDNDAKLADQQPVQKKYAGPLIDPAIIKIPEPSDAEKLERYTIMSLYNAVKSGDVQKLVNVLASGYKANHIFRDQQYKTGLHLAADKGHLACVHVLVQAGSEIDVLDKRQLSPLMFAASNGQAEVVRYLMRVGADETLKGEDGMTALHMAAKEGHLEVCKIILEECKVPRTLVDTVDDGGWTSLIWACEYMHVEVARFLLNNKCDPLIRDSEQNIALHWSAFSGSSEITEMLLNKGCDPNTVNVNGDTPLHIASRKDQYEVCVLLLSRGARIHEKNVGGETAIDCCGGTGDTLNVLQLNLKVNPNTDNGSERTIKILTNDISRGKENNQIQCVNGYDSEDKPTDFVYVIENCFTSRITVDRTITSLQSCRCEDNCSSGKCLCGTISLRCWYDDEGKLVPEFNYADPPMLFECNPACDCNQIKCNNRVVQHGLTQRFQLFRSDGKGWGLRTLRYIPKGSYVCEYVGEIITDSEADQREDDSYLFDLDNRDGETYCIDARRYGNLARFINHSCAPNLLPVRVFIEHQDLRFPRIAFFANRDIEADEELGFDYGEKFWIIKCKSFTCTCGAENCKYSDTAIQTTLDNYRKKMLGEETSLTHLTEISVFNRR